MKTADVEPGRVELRTNVARLRRRARLAALVHIVFLVAVIAGMAVTWIEAGDRFLNERSPRTGVLLFVAGCIGAGAVWHLISAGRSYAADAPRVVPYFANKYFKRDDPNRPTSTESRLAFNSGYQIAADFPYLDDLARKLDVMPLSSFGFGDDLLGQQTQWNALSDGICTVTALVDGDIPAPTQAELQTLLASLEKASETQTSFALIVRYGPDDFISGVEMEKREGTFWC